MRFFKQFLAASSKRSCNQLSIIPPKGEEQSVEMQMTHNPRIFYFWFWLMFAFHWNAGVPNVLEIQIISNSTVKSRAGLGLSLQAWKSWTVIMLKSFPAMAKRALYLSWPCKTPPHKWSVLHLFSWKGCLNVLLSMNCTRLHRNSVWRCRELSLQWCLEAKHTLSQLTLVLNGISGTLQLHDLGEVTKGPGASLHMVLTLVIVHNKWDLW